MTNSFAINLFEQVEEALKEQNMLSNVISFLPSLRKSYDNEFDILLELKNKSDKVEALNIFLDGSVKFLTETNRLKDTLPNVFGKLTGKSTQLEDIIGEEGKAILNNPVIEELRLFLTKIRECTNLTNEQFENEIENY